MSITTYLTTYINLFVGRHDDYAIQTQSGRYRRAGKPLTQSEVYDHLLGVRTYGTYIMDATGYCRFAVIDADTEDGLDRLWVIQDELATHDIVSYVERSRRGGHLWVFFTSPVPASQVRAWLLRYCPGDMEFYPKQDEGKGYGSLIRLPLGIHRKSGKRYPFVERSTSGLVSLTTTDEDLVTWFASIQRMDVPQLERTPKERPTQTHPALFSHSEQRDTNGLSPIRQWNAEQDAYQVISQYVELADKGEGEGVGQCPFGDHHTGGADKQASFKVYKPGTPGGYCWYCYTWQKGGSVFDFLKYYHGLDTQELWERIRTETL